MKKLEIEKTKPTFIISVLKDQDIPFCNSEKLCIGFHGKLMLARNKPYDKNKLERFSVHTVVQVHRTYRVTIERLDPFHAEVVESWVDLLASEAITHVDCRLCKQTKTQFGEILYKGPFSFLFKLANTSAYHDQFSGSSSMS